MSKPNKTIFYSGIETIQALVKQLHEHWKLKVNKKVIKVDKSGLEFTGKFENDGSMIKLTTEESNHKQYDLSSIAFKNTNLNNIFDINISPINYTATNTLLFAKIKSINYSSDENSFHTYRLKFSRTGNVENTVVYNNRVWLKYDNASIELFNKDGFVSTIDIKLNNPTTSSDLTCYFLYPGSDEMDIIPLHNTYNSTTKEDIYVSDIINSNSYIGKPLFWFYIDGNDGISNATVDSYGFAGIVGSSANPDTSTENGYAMNLNKWDSLPSEIKNRTSAYPYLIMYSLYHTEASSDDINTWQAAGLLFDSYGDKGRIYVISNDAAVYKNNDKVEEADKKPGATVARICDIPTKLSDFIDVDSIGAVNVVDKNYVHTEISYTEKDKNRLYNTSSNRWVKPTDLNKVGLPIHVGSDNIFIFNSEDELNDIDLVNHNNYRETIQLNGKVKVADVKLGSITSGGSGYKENDIINICVPGSYFKTTVTSVNASGSITELGDVTPVIPSLTTIPVSNFTVSDTGGITNEYDTLVQTTVGTTAGQGLKVRLIIENYDSYIPKVNSVFDDLFALVYTSEGIRLYTYVLSKTETTGCYLDGKWVAKDIISSYGKSNDRYLSIQDSYIMSTIPHRYVLPIGLKKSSADYGTYNIENDVTIDVIRTSNYVNIIDDNYTPLSTGNTDDGKTVGIGGYIGEAYTASITDVGSTDEDIIDYITNNFGRMESYVLCTKTSDGKNYAFILLYNSFNNLMSTDTSSTLPKVEGGSDKFINTNAGSNVLWNLSGVGSMMWVYNPAGKIYEDYNVDLDTSKQFGDVRVKYLSLTSHINAIIKDIVNKNKLFKNVSDNLYTKTELEEGLVGIAWNWSVYSNMRIHTYKSEENINVMYSNPTLSAYKKIDTTDKTDDIIIGNWELIFPRIDEVSVDNEFIEASGMELTYTPTKLEAVRFTNTENMEELQLTDRYNRMINNKILLINGVNMYLSKTESSGSSWTKVASRNSE